VSEYNKLYNDFMNLATEVGELETENKEARRRIDNLLQKNREFEIENKELRGNSVMMHDLNQIKQNLECALDVCQRNAAAEAEELESARQDLLAYETANWKDRLKYFLTGKMP
jgi:regulator of replication initiation timing